MNPNTTAIRACTAAGSYRWLTSLLLLAAGSLASLSCSGCKSVHWSKAEFNRGAEQSAKEGMPFGEPKRLVVIWRDAVYEHVATRPARGFGGRFYFYDSESKPVRVEGELIVYAFDDTEGSASKSETADRKYVFRAEELQSHYSETALGPSYSFWLPWDEAGGVRMSVALIPVFKSKEGKLVTGDQSVNVLSGKAPPNREKERIVADGGQIREISSAWEDLRSKQLEKAGFTGDEEENANVIMTARSVKSTTTTIPVPKGSALTSARSVPQAGASNDGAANTGADAGSSNRWTVIPPASPNRSDSGSSSGTAGAASAESGFSAPTSGKSGGSEPAPGVSAPPSSRRGQNPEPTPSFQGWADFKNPMERKSGR